MTERDETETESHRAEQGQGAAPDPRARTGKVPLAPSSTGVLGGAPASEGSTSDAERDAAAARERGRR